MSDLVLRRPSWSRHPLNNLSRIKNQSSVLLDLFFWIRRTEALTQRLFSCRGLESLSLQVRGSQRRFTNGDRVISCVWIRSARSGAFLFATLWFSYKFRFLQIRLPKVFPYTTLFRSRLPKVFPAGMCDCCQQTCRSHETQLFRNTAKRGADKKTLVLVNIQQIPSVWPT